MTRMFLAGAGFIGREHATAAASAPGGTAMELHVVDASPAALDDFMRAFPESIPYSSVDDMLSQGARDDDIAVIATPPVSHERLGLQAIESGRHVLCEKPLAMSSDQARELAASAIAHDRLLEGCDIRFRDVPTTQEVRRRVLAGSIGRPYHLTFVNVSQRSRTGFDHLTQSSWFRDPTISGGGVMMDWGPYDIAVLDEVLQPVSVRIAHAWSAAPTIADAFASEPARAEQHIGATMELTLADGDRVTVDYERGAATHGAERRLVELVGDEGAIEWDWLDWIGDNRVTTTRDVAGTPRSETIRCPAPAASFHARPLHSMLDALRDGTSARSVGDRTLFTFLWLRAVLEAAEHGGPVEIERAR